MSIIPRTPWDGGPATPTPNTANAGGNPIDVKAVGTELDDDIITRDGTTMTRAQWAAVDADPDTTLEGTPFLNPGELSDDEWANLMNEGAAEVTDVFVVDVQFAQDRAYGPSPTFDTYDEARAVGVDLLKNHADARSFSVRKSTILR